ncbi:glycosyltransferase [Sinomonas notoginsengisoli]|uniref:glycosyltransferase n=1 Tax=Sinomonas notoginsengisoli TaxID=1457311 RepID=UPI001F251FF3|nr:nucleotide disphospho-sugar-binding domain-containing protein [Sinomonas notoginsengisoli]
MSTILAYTSPAMGHLFPMTPVLLELARRGHQVHVRTLASQVGILRGLGLAAEPIDPRIEAITHHDFTVKGPIKALAASVDVFVRRGALDGPDMAAALEDIEPDLAIVDFNAWGATCAATAHGGPWASVCPYTPPMGSRGVPPFGPGLLPMAGPLGRVRDAVVRRLTIGAIEKAFLPSINEVRSQHGLEAAPTTDAFFLGTPLLLVATAEPFEYPRPDWGDNVRLVGALSWEPPAEVPAWVEEPGDPFVLVTTSSEYQADEALARAAVAGLAGEPYRVVVTMPAGVADLGPLPANVRVERFVPHSAVLAHAAAVVTHGGMGATQKALNAGVPAVVVPWGRDQLEVAARVAHARAGVRLGKARLTPERLRDAVRRAAAMADGARRVAAGYRAAGGAAAAADAVERLVPVPTLQADQPNSQASTGHEAADRP